MENLPEGTPNDDEDPTLHAINEVAETLGSSPEAQTPTVDLIEQRARALLDFTNPDNFPGIDADALARNQELRSQIPKYAALYDSPDPIERAEARRFLLLAHDFSVAVHHGIADMFEKDSHERFLREPLAPEEMKNGIFGLLGMVQGIGADMVREEYNLPAADDTRRPSLFDDDEHTLVALVLDVWIQFTDEIAAQSQLMNVTHLTDPDAAEVRDAIVEAALTNDLFAQGTPSERISLVDRVLTKLPYALHMVILQQREQRANLQNEIENL